MILKGTDPDRDKPIFLRAVEMLVAAPTDVRKTAEECYDAVAVKPENRARSAEDLRVEAANAIIERYAKTCARVGAVTSIGATIPGVGLVVTLVGAATADLVITMKYQIEMVMALASLFDRDIEDEEQQRLCYTVAGLGVATQAGLLTFENFTVKGLREAAKRLLKGKAKRWLFELFKKLGIKLTSKGILKAIPVGVGVTFSYMSNRRLTRYIGRRARDFFIEELKSDAGQTVDLDDPTPFDDDTTDPPAPETSIALEPTEEAVAEDEPEEFSAVEAAGDDPEPDTAPEPIADAVAAAPEAEDVVADAVEEPEVALELPAAEPLTETDASETEASNIDAPQPTTEPETAAAAETAEEITEDDVDAFMSDLDEEDAPTPDAEDEDDPTRLLH